MRELIEEVVDVPTAQKLLRLHRSGRFARRRLQRGVRYALGLPKRGVHKLWRRGALHPELRIGACVRRLFAQLETTVTPGIGSSSEIHSLRFNSPIATRSTEGDASRVQSQKRLSPQPLEST